MVVAGANGVMYDGGVAVGAVDVGAVVIGVDVCCACVVSVVGCGTIVL